MDTNFPFLTFNTQDNMTIENLKRETDEATKDIVFPPAPIPGGNGDELEMNGNEYVIGGF